MRTCAEFQKQVTEYVTRVRETGAHQDCPLCGQGTLIEAEVIATGKRIMFCEECDSIWSDGHQIDDAHAETFQTFVNANGKQGLDWSELKIV